MFRPIIFLISIALASCSSESSDSRTRSAPFSPPQLPPPGGTPNIFKKYSATKNSQMMDGWARNFDMSGVSFDSKLTATLVTRRHVVMANHYKRKPGSKVIFHSRKGERLERILVSARKVYGDVAVGLLNEDVPAGYKIYPLPVPRADFSDLLDQTVVVTDQNRRLFFHQISMVRAPHIAFRYQEPSLHGWGKKLISGDSGNPSFLISNGELVLIETHTTGGGGAGPFYGDPKVQALLQDAITKLAPGYQLRKKKI